MMTTVVMVVAVLYIRVQHGGNEPERANKGNNHTYVHVEVCGQGKKKTEGRKTNIEGRNIHQAHICLSFYSFGCSFPHTKSNKFVLKKRVCNSRRWLVSCFFFPFLLNMGVPSAKVLAARKQDTPTHAHYKAAINSFTSSRHNRIRTHNHDDNIEGSCWGCM